MQDEPAIGWSQDPVEPNQYRYWNGSDWTGHATVFEDGVRGFLGPWSNTWYRKVLRNKVIFHAMAWFDCSVPMTRGHLRRFMQPKEQRSLDEILALRRNQ